MSKSELLNRLIKIKQKKNFLSDTNYINYLEDLSSLYEFEIIDSSKYYAMQLLQAANLSNSKSNKMRALALLGNVYQTMNKNQLALYYYFQSYKIADEIRNIKYCLKNTRTIAFSLQYLGNFAESLKFHTYSLKYAILENDKKTIAESYTNLGIAYYYLGEYKKSLENQYVASKYFDKLKDPKRKAYCLNNIGLVYIKMNDYSNALKSFWSALYIRQKYDSYYSHAKIYGNIGLVYSKMHQHKLALENFDKCLEILKTRNNLNTIYSTFLDKADSYMELGEFENSKLNIDSAQNICNQNDNKNALLQVQIMKAKLALKQNHYQKAIENCLQAVNNINSSDIKTDLPIISNLLYQSYKHVGDNKNALKYYEIYKNSNDSILNIEKSNEMIKIQTKFEFEQEQMKFDHDQARKTLIVEKEIEKQKMIIIGIAIAFAFILILLISIVKSKNKIKNINQELIHTNEKMEHQNIEIQTQNTEIIRQAAELTHLNELKDKFVSIVSHDLRSPFVSFLGISEIMATSSEYFSKEELVEKSKQLYTSSKNMYNLLENLLELSIVHRGLKNFEGEILSLNTIINLNIDFQAYPAIKKNISIEANLDKEYEVYADENLLNSIFRNLITNAIKFTPQNGKINISVENYLNDMLKICVEDTGVGIPSDSLVNLFRLDKKVSTLGTEGEMSTGLGLLICKEYVEKHNGKIWVESEVGVGSKFFFTLKKCEENSVIQI